MPTAALALIAGSLAIQTVLLLGKKARPQWVCAIPLLAAASLLAAALVTRSVRISFVAVTNTYESLMFFSAAICVVTAVLALKARRTPGLVLFGATVVAFALLALSSAPGLPRAASPPVPALQSAWLVLHVTLSFVGEAFFAVSFAAAIVALATRDPERAASADRILYTTVGMGYPIYTVGALVFGAIWAQTAWGRYWGWDAKEIWALITWLVYTAYLHTRLVRRLRGKASAVLAIVGFLCTLFTFLGVNYLMGGLHRYR